MTLVDFPEKKTVCHKLLVKILFKVTLEILKG